MKKKLLLPIFVAIMCFLVFTKPMENQKENYSSKHTAEETELLSLMIKILELRDSIIQVAGKLKYLSNYEILLNEYEDLIDQKNVLSKNFSPETIKKITEQAQAQFANNNKHNAKPCTLF